MKLISILMAVLCIGMTIGIEACKNKTTSPASPFNKSIPTPTNSTVAKLASGTKALSVETNQNFIGFSGSSNEILQFNSNQELLGLQPGEIIIGTSGSGYMRKVLSVTNTGGVVSIETTRAKLDETFETLIFNVAQPVSYVTNGAESASVGIKRPNVNLPVPDVTFPLGNLSIGLKDISGDSVGMANINGSLSFSKGWIEAVCDIEKGKREFKFIYHSTIAETVSLQTVSGGVGASGELSFGKVEIASVIVPIPIFPGLITLNPKVNGIVGAKITIDVTCPSMVHQEDFAAGYWYKDSNSTGYFDHSNEQISCATPTYSGSGYAEVYGGVSGTLYVDDTVGPYFTASIGPKYEFSTSNNTSDVKVCFFASSGIDVNLFNFIDTKWEMFSPEACTAPLLSWTHSPTVYTVSTLAGSGSTGAADGTGTAASFHEPYGIAVDASGIVYVGDVWNNLIRKISPVGVVSTLAGQASVTGSTNGTGTDALFYMPSGVALDTTGNLYVADDYNGLIREISPVGVVSTFAGGVFAEPRGIAVDTAGNVYVADTWHYRVCKITSGGVVSTLAGSGSWGSTDGTGTAASFSGVVGVAVDTSGNVYAADQGNQCIRKITSDGVVSTLAGQAGVTGSINSTGSAASFNQPEGVAVDSSGNVYVADSANHMIRIITPGGVVSTLAGSGAQGSTDGPATTASFYTPDAIAVDASNNVYVCDGGGNTIRKITQN
jgi:sugar lactone lactonase YvrE